MSFKTLDLIPNMAMFRGWPLSTGGQLLQIALFIGQRHVQADAEGAESGMSIYDLFSRIWLNYSLRP